MKVKIVHDDLNAGGGSERLAIITIESLKEMGFEIDIETFTKPNFDKIKNDFGKNITDKDISRITITNLQSLLGRHIGIHRNINDVYRISIGSIKDEYCDDGDNNYDLIINTHADLLPYYSALPNQERDGNIFKHKEYASPMIISYCHYPLVPIYIANGKYDEFLNKFYTSYSSLSSAEKRVILHRALQKYNEMIKNTIILTNSYFSKNAIERIYGKDITPNVVYPPADIMKFRIDSTSKSPSSSLPDSGSPLTSFSLPVKRDTNSILIIARFNPAKNLENAIEIGRCLKDKGNKKINNFKMTIVGNLSSDYNDYIDQLMSLIKDYDLEDNIRIEPNVKFPRLLDLVQHSSIYIHPTIGEPFGISIIEAMSAGLIPITPNVGGCIEFVPSKYQYKSVEHAADIISDILTNKTEEELFFERKRISESVKIFAEDTYKRNLESIITSIIGRRIKMRPTAITSTEMTSIKRSNSLSNFDTNDGTNMMGPYQHP